MPSNRSTNPDLHASKVILKYNLIYNIPVPPLILIKPTRNIQIKLFDGSREVLAPTTPFPENALLINIPDLRFIAGEIVRCLQVGDIPRWWTPGRGLYMVPETNGDRQRYVMRICEGVPEHGVEVDEEVVAWLEVRMQRWLEDLVGEEVARKLMW